MPSANRVPTNQTLCQAYPGPGRLLMWVVIFCGFVALSSPRAGAADTCQSPVEPKFQLAPQCFLPKALNLCFLSLNNEREFPTVADFVNRIQELYQGPYQINVLEFQIPETNPYTSIERLVESKITCHGMVLSGSGLRTADER